MKKLLTTFLMMAILSTLSSQQSINWDCYPQSYENVARPTPPSACEITAVSTPTTPYVIRVGVYNQPITSYPDVIGAEVNSKYYYYYNRFFSDRRSAELVLGRLQEDGRFCDAYIQKSPFPFISFIADFS